MTKALTINKPHDLYLIGKSKYEYLDFYINKLNELIEKITKYQYEKIEKINSITMCMNYLLEEMVKCFNTIRISKTGDERYYKFIKICKIFKRYLLSFKIKEEDFIIELEEDFQDSSINNFKLYDKSCELINNGNIKFDSFGNDFKKYNFKTENVDITPIKNVSDKYSRMHELNKYKKNKLSIKYDSIIMFDYTDKKNFEEYTYNIYLFYIDNKLTKIYKFRYSEDPIEKIITIYDVCLDDDRPKFLPKSLLSTKLVNYPIYSLIKFSLRGDSINKLIKSVTYNNLTGHYFKLYFKNGDNMIEIYTNNKQIEIYKLTIHNKNILMKYIDNDFPNFDYGFLPRKAFKIIDIPDTLETKTKNLYFKNEEGCVRIGYKQYINDELFRVVYFKSIANIEELRNKEFKSFSLNNNMEKMYEFTNKTIFDPIKNKFKFVKDGKCIKLKDGKQIITYYKDGVLLN